MESEKEKDVIKVQDKKTTTLHLRHKATTKEQLIHGCMSQLAYPHLCFPPFTPTQKEKHVSMEARIRAGPTGSP